MGPHNSPVSLHLDRHPETGDEVDLTERRHELFTRALGEAPSDDEPRPGLSQAVELEDGLDRLLARGLDESARVHDDKVGLTRIPCRLIAAGGQATDQLLRVHLILRAPERRDPKALVHLRSVPMPGGTGLLAFSEPLK